MSVEAIQNLIQALPKAELHVHLEGCMTPEFVYNLASRHGHSFMDMGIEEVEKQFRHKDFPEFLDHFRAVTEVLQTPSDMRDLVLHYVQFAKQSNIVYAEVHLYCSSQLSDPTFYRMMMEAVQQGVDEAKGYGVELQIILDTAHHLGPERGLQVLQLHLQHPFPCVVGIGKGGSETDYPVESSAELYSRARQAGLRTVVHTGEMSGADLIWQSLKHLYPDRILHGIRAVDDESLVQHLVEIGMPLDICPSGNVATQVVPSIEEHPVRKLFDAGVRITINTDDPAMFGTTLNREFQLLVDQLHFTAEEIFLLAQEAFRVSFLPAERKNQYLQAQHMIWQAFQDGHI